MTDFKTSEAVKDLMRTFVDESQIRNRYTFAARLAKKQKTPMVETVFKYTANQEKGHTEIFCNYLKPLDKGTILIDGGYLVDLEENTLAQLNAAVHNEYEEHDVVYKSFAEVAEKEGFAQITVSFRMIAEIEKTHGERFQHLVDLSGEGRLYDRQEKNSRVCTSCGCIYEGEEPLQLCPVCHHNQGYFAGQELSPWFLKAWNRIQTRSGTYSPAKFDFTKPGADDTTSADMVEEYHRQRDWHWAAVCPVPYDDRRPEQKKSEPWQRK